MGTLTHLLRALTPIALILFSQPSPAEDRDNCPAKRIGWPESRERGRFAWPTAIGVRAGEMIDSACIRLTDIGSLQQIAPAPAGSGWFSVNDGPFLDSPQRIRHGDRIRARIRASSKADGRAVLGARFDNTIQLGTFEVRTQNQPRPGQIFHVGPNRPIKQLAELAATLVAGDTVLVDSGTYAPVRFDRAGTRERPITIRGNGEKRPIISGGQFGVRFLGSHHTVFERFEVTGSSLACIVTQANELILRELLVHNCERHGILGADEGNGSNTIELSEITRTGSHPVGENRKHPIYIATDRDAFPGATLRVQSSYLHDNIGESIKSRSARSEIYFNWIDVGADARSLYSLSLYGFEIYQTLDPQNSDVVGNVLVHRGRYGIRLGGDGTGASKGRVRLANNTLVLGPDFGDSPVIRLFQSIDSVYLTNNVVIRSNGASEPVRLFRNEIPANAWVGGRIKLAGDSNWLPLNSTIVPAAIEEWQTPLRGAVLLESTQLDELNLTPLPGSALLGIGHALTRIAPEYSIGSMLTELETGTWPRAPASGTVLRPPGRNERRNNIGAH